MSITPLEYGTSLILTIILLCVKFLTASYLGYKIYLRRKETGQFSLFSFIFSVFLLLICLFLSRLFYSIFDFVLTNLNPALYHVNPNTFFWKIGVLISALGYGWVLFIVDRSILKFKFKGIFSYIIVLIAFIVFIFPVTSASEFQLVSFLLFFINIIAIILPILFLYIGKKAAEFKKPAYLIAVGVIIYAIGANILVETIVAALDSLLPGIRIVIYFLSLIFKISGLVLFSYAVINFVEIFSK
ncbi:MAG: hypothetical protein GF311_08195 [Candidatus Lokiarchaeota archaeon]|nr:hypothetical protein [Candidatus Lokiarchaeota archaeon]